MVDSLEEKMALADDEISKRRADLDAPVRRLPSEILVEIFAVHSAAFSMRENYDAMDDLAFDRLAQAPLLGGNGINLVLITDSLLQKATLGMITTAIMLNLPSSPA
ncbi:hypothetical protein C8R43DRAFT_1132238 [Mycena crocata]|nr:hypothetical protein C8R43DRAFT_1132238 [Mycena crocata]